MGYRIRRMQKAELSIAIDWAKQEGWNPGLHDHETFFAADPNGFFAGELDGEIIATGAAIAYDDHFAFCGLYIVKPDFRGKGYGIELTRARLNYTGNRITGLDGVLSKVEKYEHLGYVKAFKNRRFQLNDKPATIASDRIRTILFNTSLAEFDRRYFPAFRNSFLKAWMSQGHALGYLERDHLRGYGVIRECFEGFKIGPLFAENKTIARILLTNLAAQVRTGPIFLDVPEVNKDAIQLVEECSMQPIFEVIRMYRNGFPKIDIKGVFGITTYELG